MGFFSGISSFCSSVCSGISSAVHAVGNFICDSATTIVRGISAGIETVKTVVDNIGNKILNVGKNLLCVSPDVKVEEIAEKLTQPNIREREEMESADNYLNYLHNEVPFDEERWLSMKDEDKVAAKAVASTLISECITEKTGVELSPEFLLSMEKAKLSHNQVSKYIEEFSKRHIKSMNSVQLYLEGKLSDNEYDEVRETLIEAEKELNPKKSEEEISLKLVEMRTEYNKSNEEWGTIN